MANRIMHAAISLRMNGTTKAAAAAEASSTAIIKEKDIQVLTWQKEEMTNNHRIKTTSEQKQTIQTNEQKHIHNKK